MMLDWNGYREQLVETIAKMLRLSPDTVRGYAALSKAGTKTNRLDAKARELIALAVAVTLRCDGCITVHTDGIGDRDKQTAHWCLLVNKHLETFWTKRRVHVDCADTM